MIIFLKPSSPLTPIGQGHGCHPPALATRS
jgi:hypothetical protein